MTDVHLWKASASMDRSLSRVVPWYDDLPCKHCGNNPILDKVDQPYKAFIKDVLLEVAARHAIFIKAHYLSANVAGNNPFWKSQFFSREFLCENSDTPSREILQIHWQPGCPTGLHKPILSVLHGCPNLKDLELVRIELRAYYDPRDRRLQGRYSVQTPSEAEAVAALVFTSDGDLTVTWLRRRREYSFIKYRSTTTPDGAHYYIPTEEIHLSGIGLYEQITHAEIRGGLVVLISRKLQMPRYLMSLPPPGTPLGTHFAIQGTSLQAEVAGFTTARMGIYLAQCHLHRPWNVFLQRHDACSNAALKLFISSDAYHTDTGNPALQGAYIVRAVETSGESCTSPFTFREITYHRYVARLADMPDLDNLPSIGLRVAVSPRASRIALAAWRTLRIYAFDPMSFLTTSRDHATDHIGVGSRLDPYFAHVWRSGYYDNYTYEGEHVVLKPVAVPSTGVIHALRWVSEDELWGVTDEGVCRWNFGVSATGKAAQGELEYCAGDLGLRRAKRRFVAA